MEYAKKPVNKLKMRTPNDYLDVENADGMPGLVDSTLALDFLMAAKNGVRTYAIALTEISDPEARTVIKDLLKESLELHAQISDLMMVKGWFHPYEVEEQFRIDKVAAGTALHIAGWKLFPDDSSRLGTFATPNV